MNDDILDAAYVTFEQHDFYKVDVNQRDGSERHTPIMMLAMGLGRPEMAAMLLRHHVDLSLRDRQGNTAVMLAVSHRNSKMLKVTLPNMAHLTAWTHKPRHS